MGHSTARSRNPSQGAVKGERMLQILPNLVRLAKAVGKLMGAMGTMVEATGGCF